MEVGRNWEKREGKHNQDILSEGKAVFNNLKKREKGRHGIPAYRRLKKNILSLRAVCSTQQFTRPHWNLDHIGKLLFLMN